MPVTFNVRFEVPFEVTEEQLHEDLCKTLHENQGPTIAYIDVGFPVEEPEVLVYPTRVPITEWDNRDPSETWLFMDNLRYIEVRPYDVMRNMIDNCYNEDVLFLYEQFQNYLNDVVDKISDVQDDTDTDHIKGFHGHLSRMIAQSGADKMIEDDESGS